MAIMFPVIIPIANARCAWILLGRTSAMKSADGLERVLVPFVDGPSKQPKLGVINYTMRISYIF